MNKIVLLSVTCAITLLVFFIIYLVPYFSKKKIREGKFDVQQFINLFFTPLLVIPILYFIKELILRNPAIVTIHTPKYINELAFLFLLYFMILGNGIHSVSVVLSKHMKRLKGQKIWEVNEFFHNAFSHFLITFSGVFILFSFVIMEINHPSTTPLTRMELILVLVSGIVTGVILGLGCIEGSIAFFMLPILYLLSLILPFIFMRHSLDFRFFPFTSFMEVVFTTSAVTMFVYRKIKKGFPEIVPQYFFD
jgi:hypothetical protein